VTASKFIASGFGIGFIPIAAGTVASFVATVIGAGLMGVSSFALMLAAALCIGAGLFVIQRGVIKGDPSWVVIDEFAGQFIALLGLAHISLVGLLAAFVLFRFFDVTKLGPVGWADRQHGAFGIMADDVIAGVIAALILSIINAVWPGHL
jgi:phosphatidylglycerophosphatase A